MPQRFFTSTIGQKVLMAVTGVVLFGFIVGHMAGNLQVFLGAEAFNAYSVSLHELLHGAGLWVVRLVLLLAVVLHIVAATTLTVASRRARPVAYRAVAHDRSTYASRTMRWSGPIIVLFVVYHLLDLTLGRVNPGFDPANPYRNLVASFQRPAVVLFYAISVLALALHLRHGAWSMLQSLGISHPRYDRGRDAGAAAFAALVAVGFLVVPLAVQAGWVR
jgi:succinate dehydrogenase / fumarate reductase cytochrome b subunit